MGLYRSFLRTAKTFPLSRPLRFKTAFNVRLAFRLRQWESDPATVARLVDEGERSLRVLQHLAAVDIETLQLIFRKNEPMLKK